MAGFLASIFIGISLGLIGGGGSILTLPVLVYLLGINPVLSVTYSMFIVGTTSLVGSVNYMRQQQVNYKTALFFALPSFLTIYLTRTFIVPAIPDPVFTIDTFVLTKNVAVMVFFALIMLAASMSMIRNNSPAVTTETDEQRPFNWPVIVLDGALVGILTGIVGAGGGFLIIPALVLLARLPMKVAVGTSLLIIAANSLIGFGNSFAVAVDWSFLLKFTALSVVGIFVGTYLTRFIPGQKLKKSFGWFVLIMGVYIISRELFFNAG